ncbi:cupin domain-containing protein [Chromobacterium subtsugae]|uniref:Cupin domain-containing protein n=1 Tax=Chromobacterium subtsugae TaxID=251747 RepID=A0ABS7FJP1_9NEIS|nr:cupin domain-containing protein [Chromobacterium sp. F49]KUM03807.1 cupin [Chromobacterium subtsugae]KZE85528.1 cupin [Chromobacterium sp. F49]MBW7568929.1 cupin domain-containing protein [Chromobacterium subtsugae]MBW8289951.1 cupin domain-containing protein [Chromobacterium subtsugae]OBU84760.1 cupin [Chromobacterium subtsugae]
MSRPSCIRHWRELEKTEPSRYPDSQEDLARGAPLGRHFGFARLGIHHERLEPGQRTSWPHAESTEDEFIHVLEGEPDLWLDGALHRLQPGDSVGFKAGDGQAHTVINNTEQAVRLLVVGDATRADNQVHYPRHPARNAAIGKLHWAAAPARPDGGHDGLPDKLRDSDGPF